ncbi:hypothetical protein GLYMA_15G027550v4 [Glycine max]|nr:hypothetical protein GLYMA_15G027550v4 [Glycine max]KAH1145223.1 hypothetical protein GYH30_041151 [Glycine max]
MAVLWRLTKESNSYCVPNSRLTGHFHLFHDVVLSTYLVVKQTISFSLIIYSLLREKLRVRVRRVVLLLTHPNSSKIKNAPFPHPSAVSVHFILNEKHLLIIPIPN